MLILKFVVTHFLIKTHERPIPGNPFALQNTSSLLCCADISLLGVPDPYQILFVVEKESFELANFREIISIDLSKSTAMLSVASLLNPVKSEPQGIRLPSSPSSSLGTTSSHGSPLLTSSLIKKQKMTKDGAVFAKGKIKGEVNFPPFEQFDGETIREVQRFEVYPLGKIQEYCRHIPYNSEKKNFLEKTGRESFEGWLSVFLQMITDSC